MNKLLKLMSVILTFAISITLFTTDVSAATQFRVTDLTINPTFVTATNDNNNFTVSVKVTNSGAETGIYKVELKINDATETTKDVSLEAGRDQAIIFPVSRKDVGEYNVAIDDLKGVFDIAPASLDVKTLIIEPIEATPGKEITISIIAQNKSTDQPLTYNSLKLFIDGAVSDKKQLELKPGDSSTISFKVTKNEAGSFVVNVGSQTGSFTVKSSSFVDSLTKDPLTLIIIIVALLIVIMVVVLLTTPKKKGKSAGKQAPLKKGQRGPMPAQPAPGGSVPQGQQFPGGQPQQMQPRPMQPFPGQPQPAAQQQGNPQFPTQPQQIPQQPAAQFPGQPQQMQPRPMQPFPGQPQPAAQQQGNPQFPAQPQQIPQQPGAQFPGQPQMQPRPMQPFPGQPQQMPQQPTAQFPGQPQQMQPRPAQPFPRQQPAAPPNPQPFQGGQPPQMQPRPVTPFPMQPQQMPQKPGQFGQPPQQQGFTPTPVGMPGRHAPPFTVSNLVITPQQVKEGDTVNISATVTNNTPNSGQYSMVLRIAGVVENISELTLNANSSQTALFTIIRDTPGEYYVEVDGQRGAFTVTRRLPAAFNLSNLTITPERVKQGEPVTISTIISNSGETAGNYSVVLRIKGIAESIEEVELGPSRSQKVVFSVIKDAAGFYPVAIENLTGKFVIEMDWKG